MDITSAYRELGSYRAAAEVCGTTHKTVKRVIDRFEADDQPPDRKERARNYDAVAQLVAERVERSHGRITAKRLLPVARAAGYEGSARNFRRLVATAKTRWRREHHRGRRPAAWAPGDYLVIDWAVIGGLHMFCAVLAFSRWRFVRFTTNETATTTLGHPAQGGDFHLATSGDINLAVDTVGVACGLGCGRRSHVFSDFCPTLLSDLLGRVAR